jgi:hypothetical protein
VATGAGVGCTSSARPANGSDECRQGVRGVAPPGVIAGSPPRECGTWQPGSAWVAHPRPGPRSLLTSTGGGYGGSPPRECGTWQPGSAWVAHPRPGPRLVLTSAGGGYGGSPPPGVWNVATGVGVGCTSSARPAIGSDECRRGVRGVAPPGSDSPPGSYRCRTASKTVTAAAMAALRESAEPAMGMRAVWSAAVSHWLLRPYCSEPTTRATGPVRSMS